MKANQLAALTLRLLGVYCLIQIIPTISLVTTAVSFAQGSPVDGGNHALANVIILLGALLPFGFRVLLGVLLIVYSVPWGERLAPKDFRQENLTAISLGQIQALAFAIAGVLILATALPSLFKSLSDLGNWLTIQTRHAEFRSDYASRNGLTAIGTFVEAALGCILFFRAHRIASFWSGLRDSGTPKSSPMH